MTQAYFPLILTRKTSEGVEAVLGLAMKSILKGDLFFDNKIAENSEDLPHVNINEFKMMNHRESFICAVSAWPRNVSLELLATSLPNLCFSARGRLLITIILRVSAKDLAQARKEAAAKYLSLRALLLAHWSEAEFIPIIHRDELNFRLSPFKPRYALAIRRRTKKIAISDPVKRTTVTGLVQRANDRKATERASVEYTCPWTPSYDDWSRLIAVMMGQLDPLQLLIRLRASAFSDEKRKTLEDRIRICELYSGGGKAYEQSLAKQASMLCGALSERVNSFAACAVKAGVFLLAGHDIDPSLGMMVGQALTAKPVLRERESSLAGGFAAVPLGADRAQNSRYFPEKSDFTAIEAACAFRLPSPPAKEIPGLPIRRSRTSLSLMPDQVHDKNDGIHLCRNIHNGMAQPVHLPADDRMRHMFLIGQTGTGKSTMMESFILQDIRDGHGLAVIDPHGEMVDNILGKIPESRLDDVIVFDFLDRERPLGFNLLEWQTEEERDFVIDEIYDTLDRIYVMSQTGGPIFETNLRGMLRLLMGSKPRNDYKPTILEFRDCYLHEKFRKWLVARLDDRITEDFVREIERSGGDAHINNISQYVTSKFGRFVHDTTLMNIIGQETTAFNFDDIMAQGKIFLVKLGKGRFGPSVSALLANQLVARFKHAAMKRGEMRPEDRRDFYLYVDECHNLPASNFTELLSEARKYRMGLVLATQYATQLVGNDPRENLLSAIIGNVGCMMIFRLGQEDAKLLAQSLYPHFNMMDIIGLPNWQGYCRVQIKNSAVTPFSFESVIDQTPYDPQTARKVSDLSRKIYGCDLGTIKRQIEKRQNIWKE